MKLEFDAAMRRGRDFGPAYRHFEKISTNVSSNLERFKCTYCAAEYLRNHTKMLHQLKIQCKKVPEYIKQQLSHLSGPKASDSNPSTSTSVSHDAAPENTERSTTMSGFLDSMSSKEQVRRP